MITLDDLRNAAVRIRPFAHRTPVMTSRTLSNWSGAELHFKCENLQRVGAFKFRGATNAIFSLTEEEARYGVATHSSGNHAQAVALAGRLRGTPAHVVMPRNAPRVKTEAVRDYGAHIIWCEPTLAAREATLEEIVRKTGAVFIHPYEHPHVIAGQGTAALELLEDVPDIEMLIAPVGGGGLLSGTAIAATGQSNAPRVIGAEPAGADDAYRSFQSGTRVPAENPTTVADGLRTSLGELPFSIIRTHVSEIVTVDEESILRAMRQVWERMKIVIEPSAAVAVAAALSGKIALRGKRVGIILSGGNVDFDQRFG